MQANYLYTVELESSPGLGYFVYQTKVLVETFGMHLNLYVYVMNVFK